MNSIRVTAAAQSEFLKEVTYYEEIRKGLGTRFRKAVAAAFEKSAEFPLHGKLGVVNTRRILVEGFPFAIFYTFDGNTVVVHAVAHLSRKPYYFQSRLIADD